MSPARTLLAAIIALAVMACTDTPTATESVDGLAFAKPDDSGVVTRFTVINFLTMTDFDNDLRATVGFDREGWCDAGLGTGDAFGDHLEFIKEHDVQRTILPNGEVTDVRVWEGILVV